MEKERPPHPNPPPLGEEREKKPLPRLPDFRIPPKLNGMLLRIALFILSLMVVFPGHALDWPQWRGPNRDGTWNESGLLQRFPKEGFKPRWRKPVGMGYSSPVVVKGRVFVTDVQLEKPGPNCARH